MGKISINIPDPTEKQIRDYAKEKDITLTNACISLFNKGLDNKDKGIDQKKYKELKDKYKKLEEELKQERLERIKVLDNYKNFNTKLLNLMEADRILQIEQKEPKKNLLHRIKTFFIGEKQEN
jgi:hypothetical protein